MRILVTGASGQLGAYLLRELRGGGADVVAWSGSRSGELFGVPVRPADLTDLKTVVGAFRDARPDVVLHAAALSAVAACHRAPVHASLVNAGGSALLAELAPRLVFVSTDLVFDGERGNYVEEDHLYPLSVYGRTKAAAEAKVLAHPRHAVARVSLLFGPSRAGRPTFFDEQVAALRERRPCTLFADEWRTPLSLLTAARGLIALARSDFTGVLHMGGPERLSRLEIGRRLASYLGVDGSSLVESTRAAVPSPEPRPRDTSLNSARWRSLFPNVTWLGWEEALRELLSD